MFYQGGKKSWGTKPNKPNGRGSIVPSFKREVKSSWLVRSATEGGAPPYNERMNSEGEADFN